MMNSCREEARFHPPRDMSSSETGHCFGGIDATVGSTRTIALCTVALNAVGSICT
eukprot:gene27309-biopygen8463